MHSTGGAVSAADADVAKLCGRRKNIIVKSFSYWREPEQRPPSHVYDLRSYVLTVSSIASSEKLSLKYYISKC